MAVFWRQSNPNMTDRNTLEAQLLDLIFDHRAIEFAELSRAFNPLRVLGVEHYEIRHANTLAWLLTPSESHGLGDAFARQFLKIACDQNNSGLGKAILAAVASTGLDAVHVRREVTTKEMERLAESEAEDAIEGKPDADETGALSEAQAASMGLLDVLIQGDSWVVAIEAKVRSRQHSEQLKRYAGSLTKGAPYMHRLHVFLSNDLTDAAYEPWSLITWDELVAAPLRLILDRLPTARHGEPQVAFLRSFLDVVDEHCLPPKGRREALLAELVADYSPLLNGIQGRQKGGKLTDGERELVAQNAVLIKKLAQRFKAPNVLREPMLKGLIQADDRLVLAGCSIGYVRFVMKAWLKQPWIHGAQSKRARGDYGVVCEIENSRDKGVQFKLQIRFLGDGIDERRPQRELLLELIRSAIKERPELAQRFPRAHWKADGSYFTIYSTEWLGSPLADDQVAVATLLETFMPSALAMSEFMAQVPSQLPT